MTILRNVNIWDGVGRVAAGIDAIEFEGGRITRLGSSDELVGKDTRELAGCTIIPGLIDAHVHLCLDPDITDPLLQDKFSDEELLAAMSQRAARMAAAGITSARDLGGGRWLELKVRDRIMAGELTGPRLLCSGQPVTSVKGHCHFWGGEATDLREALAVVARQQERGVDLIKIMATGGNLTPGSRPIDTQFPPEILAAIVAAAKENNQHVAAHCHGTDGIGCAVDAGVRTIEHCSWVGEQGWARNFDPDIAARIGRSDAWVSPTINAGWRRRIGQKPYEDTIQENYRKMQAAGIRLIASTDAGIPRVYHHELPLALPVFAHFAGLTGEQTLRAATSDCAEAIGLGALAGRLQPSYSADLCVYDSDPVVDLSVLAQPVAVYTRGIALSV